MKLTARILSVVLVLFVTLSFVPGVSLRAYADTPVTGIEITNDASALSIEKGGTVQLNANVTPDDATDKTLAWSSSDDSVATVNPTTGLVTGVAPGTADITATANDSSSVTASKTVTVNPKINSVTVSPKNPAVITEVNGTVQLSAAVDADPDETANKNVTWSSSDNTIATVDDTGKVTGKASGTATITATSTVNTNKKDAAAVIVSLNPATGLALSPTTLNMEKDGEQTLTLTKTPADTTDPITWSSSDESVATVDQNGKVTAKAAGTATITAATPATGSNKTATCNVTVTEPSTSPKLSVTVSAAPNPVKVDENSQLTATVKDKDNNTVTPDSVTWTVTEGESNIVWTDKANGKFKGNHEGTAKVKATATKGSDTATSSEFVITVNPKNSTPTSKTYAMSKPNNAPTNLYKNKVGGYYIYDIAQPTASPDGFPAGVTVDKWLPENATVANDTLYPSDVGTAKIGAKMSDGTNIPSTDYTVYSYVDKDPKTREYVKGTKKDLKFKIGHSKEDGSAYNFEAFKAAGPVVMVNGKKDYGVLTYEKDYTAREGSVEITLSGDFLEKLDPGDYYLTAQFRVTPDNYQLVNSDIIRFTVKSAGSGSNPGTADYLYVGLGVFMFLLALTYVALFTYDKKQRKIRLRRRMAHRRYY